MTTGVQYQATSEGSVFQLIKDDVTGEYYWITNSVPGGKFKQVFVPVDFDDPAIVQ